MSGIYIYVLTHIHTHTHTRHTHRLPPRIAPVLTLPAATASALTKGRAAVQVVADEADCEESETECRPGPRPKKWGHAACLQINTVASVLRVKADGHRLAKHIRQEPRNYGLNHSQEKTGMGRSENGKTGSGPSTWDYF